MIKIKKHSLLFISIISFSVSLFSNTDKLIQEKLTPKNSVLAWDYHDVLVKKDWPSMKQQVWTLIQTDWKLLRFIIWPPFLKMAFFNTYGSAEERIHEMCKKYPSLQRHNDTLINLINTHTPIQESVDLLKGMKQEGYKNYLASNMGEESYILQKQRHPDIIEQFEGRYLPEKEPNGLSVAKPSTKYFDRLRNYLIENHKIQDQKILFIDDKNKNILGARKSNKVGLNHIYGIHFTSPEQLRAALNKKMEFKNVFINPIKAN